MAPPRDPSRATIARRRAVALLLVAVIAAIAWLALRDGEDQGEPAAAAPSTASAAALEQAGAMSDSELADQVLLLGFEGADAAAPTVAELGERQLGGLLLRAENRIDPVSARALADALHEAGGAGGRVPPLLAASQEGGPYRAFADLPPEASQLEVGDAGSPAQAEDWARAGAAALREAGIDLDLFPVADVATLDSAIGDRAFSDDASTVAELTVAALRGCADAGIACAPLHFPGLGATAQDTSRGPATVGLDPAALEARDLEPFRAAFEAGAPAVVLSLALYTAYDPVTPGALAEPVATGLLRGELGFEGVAISDDLGSGAVRSGSSVPKAAVAAVAAGADLLQIASPDDQEGVREALVRALGSGELPRERLVEAAARVLDLKRTLGLVAEPE